jgi:tocopherol O-methyltransferase
MKTNPGLLDGSMILPRVPAGPGEVAGHYDELDMFYRDLWGEHVHHGLWSAGDDPDDGEQATLRLLEIAVSRLALRPGDRVVDIGCGYGGSARWLAGEQAVSVTGVTLSKEQVLHASDFPAPESGEVVIRLMDWLENDFPNDHFEGAIAIESLAHMPDKREFFRQLARTLKPGGTASICCWLAAPDANAIERHQLRRICEEGRLPGLPTVDVYLEMAASAGLVLRHRDDLTESVARTWTLIAKRMTRRFLTDRRYLKFVLSRVFREWIFALTVPRMILMFATGGIRYGWLVFEKVRD